MSKIKSLVLGSAAAIVAIGGAQAADLPLKAKAVEYVKVCSLYGAGFYYIPGTDTCIRLGGYLRAEVNFGSSPTDNTYLNGDGGLGLRTAGDYQSRSRIMVRIDTRTATEYGVVRTYASFGPQFSFGATNASTDVPGSGSMRVEAAFVQFAGFTFGRSASAYALPWNGAPGNINAALLGGPNYDAGINNIQYTWQFGNGVSASVGIDQQSRSNRVGVAGAIPNTTYGTYTDAYAAPTAPDIVGRIRLDQAWGLIQLSAAAHQTTGNYYSLTNPGLGHPDDKWGFAVTGGLQIKNLPTGPGDDIKISGTYAEGALRYVLGNSGSTPTNFQVLNGTTFSGVTIADGVYGGVGTSIQQTKAYGFNGAFNHNWNRNWSSSVFGSYSHVDYNDTVATAWGYNPDFNVSQLGVSTTWKPVKNLALIVEGTWVHIDQNRSGVTPNGTNGTGGATLNTIASGIATFGDTNAYSGVFRVQRDF